MMFPLGDSAVLIEFGGEIDRKINQSVLTAARYLKDHPFPGMIEVVPAYTTLTVHYDPLQIKSVFPYDKVCQEISSRLEKAQSENGIKGQTIQIPVCYDKEFALDLSYVAESNGLSEKEVIDIHTSTIYDVYFLGFSPGFPFLGGMNTKIATPRKSSPRLIIPKGSVGIAGKQTGIYPLETPGGWQIIGRTPIPLFSLDKFPPTLLQPGDQVQFVSITREEFYAMEEQSWE
ncbi:5-oxoprolinase subunit PxpB [Heyndrickxia sp. NPDC080065]|uniref:5-oxoprolinase subunit PxpB n=1 Tax=Heyndrickxia sp. NPDC080065 TaxID=3390568 RepID=UPI003D058D6F